MKVIPNSKAKPESRFRHSAVVSERKKMMIVFGGSDGTQKLFNDIWCFSFGILSILLIRCQQMRHLMFSTEKKEWTELHQKGTVPTARCGHSMILTDYSEDESLQVFLF